MEQNTYACPACGSSDLTFNRVVKDHFLSKDSFSLHSCEGCDLLFTSSRPSENEIGSYYKSENYVSHSSSNKGVINKLYKLVRKRTLKQKIHLLKSMNAGHKLLDIGAGTGHFLKLAKRSGFDAVGLEPDDDARKVALDENKVELKRLNELDTLSPASFDVLTLWHVLEHVYHLKKDVLKMASILKENALLIIAVPNYTSYDSAHYKEYWAAYDVPRHLYHFEPKSITNLFESCGFELINVKPMKYDAFYVSMLSEKYKNGSLFNALYRGLISNLKARNNKYSSQIYVFRKSQK